MGFRRVGFKVPEEKIPEDAGAEELAPQRRAGPDTWIDIHGIDDVMA